MTTETRYIEVKVSADARSERIEKMEGKEGYFVWVKEPKEANRANVRVMEMMAIAEDVPLACVRIVKGHRLGKKIIKITK